ncbi:hypothetical protein GOP47_0030276 [Adiantum capillus-veneris]|nr:hypothetical protein GOP47_0030276 [Adiantum capillus-veneris]
MGFLSEVIAVLLLFFASAEGFAFQSTDEDVLKLEPLLRIRELAAISDSPHHLQRTFLSKASLEAGKLIQAWMEDAGMSTWVDDIGNVHGRVAGKNPSAPALLLGSHYDTVIDAGMYDGAFGIIAAVAAVKALHVGGLLDTFPRPIEIIAFSDEEGVRFQSTFLGSAAIAGKFSEHLLSVLDKSGTTLEAALKTSAFPGTPESITNIKYDTNSVWGYVEVHIEQGPVLERQGIPVGVVGAIAGQTRLSVNVKGLQGHAGTVPMAMRRDPMTAAAAAIVSIEHICKHPEEFLSGDLVQSQRDHFVLEGALVCTVGEIATWPGASNVIPGEVSFTIDVRAEDDSVRKRAVVAITKSIQDLSLARQVHPSIEIKHEAGAVHCDTLVQDRLQLASTEALQKLPSSGPHVEHEQVPTLVSGAGHDALMMAHMTKVGMLFVRCTGGISHSPDEHVLEDDVYAASLTLKEFLLHEIPTGNGLDSSLSV